MSDHQLLSSYRNVYKSVDPKVSKEISMNLLQRMLTLYIRVRTFSYNKSVKEKYQIAKGSAKQKSLRTEIKISSKNSDTSGH